MTPYLNFRRTHWSEHRPWLLLAGLVAIGTTLAGCAGASTAPVPVVMPTAPASATVTLCDSSTPSCGGVSTFSLSSIRDLSIAVSWQNVSQGTHSQTLRIVLPDGNLYQAMEMSFEIPNGSS